MQILGTFKNIKKLDLSYNPLKDKVIQEISKPITNLNLLQSVNMAKTNGKSIGMNSLLKALINKSITHLDIGENATSDKEISYLKNILVNPNSTNFRYLSTYNYKAYPAYQQL